MLSHVVVGTAMTVGSEAPQPSIYAELLANIRQVSVSASLPSEPDSTTEVCVGEQGTRIDIRHAGIKTFAYLPGRVKSNANLPVSSNGQPHMAWRLPLLQDMTRPPPTPFSAENQVIPWDATDLEPGCGLSCRSCGEIFINEGVINVWKDLPSENWAEMMEFWHCHKPHDRHEHHSQSHAQHAKEHLATRGYGASSAIAPQNGVGLVDVSSFMLDERNCKNLKVSLRIVTCC